ncbi:MAG: hypothetical protein V4629_11115 [Pseudomonadota bacterium]
MHRTARITHSLSELSALPESNQHTSSCLSGLSDFQINAKQSLYKKSDYKELKNASIDELIDLSKIAVADTRLYLGKPINQNILSLFACYRERSVHWLPLRAQRAEPSSLRSEFSKNYKEIKTQDSKRLKIELRKLNNTDLYTKNFSSVLGKLPRVSKNINNAIRNLRKTPCKNNCEEILKIYEDSFQQRIADIKDFTVGNCAEFGFTVADKLKKDGFSHNVLVIHTFKESKKDPNISFRNHALVLIGVEKLSYNQLDWGTNFVCVDAWSNDVYTFSDLNKTFGTIKNSKFSLIRMVTRHNVKSSFLNDSIQILHMRLGREEI